MYELRKLLMLLLMLILPVQGLAAVYTPLHKTLGQAVDAMPCHDQQAAHHADDNNTGAAHDTDAASHLCCHQVFTGAASSVLTTAAHKFSDIPRFVLPLATLFIPDSPDRPPRG